MIFKIGFKMWFSNFVNISPFLLWLDILSFSGLLLNNTSWLNYRFFNQADTNLEEKG